LPPQQDALTTWLLNLAKSLDPENAIGAKPATRLPSGDLTWQEWRERYGGGVVDKPLAPHHTRVWEWFEALQPGVHHPALIECWSRGHGKSTTVETNICRLCATANRRFVLYVSGTQEAADRHVQAIGVQMERMGVERAMGKYGFARGWNGTQLRAANGFNVLAFGLNGGTRGVKLDELRPDIIVLDDIDDRHDSIEAAAKKTETVSQTVLPAGSDDCAVIFVQNEIHSYSVMAQTLSGENGILLDRFPTEKIPAVVDLKYEKYINERGQEVFEITGGTPTWAGKDLEVCEFELNKFGAVSFERECQHRTGLGTTFYSEFSADRHCIAPLYQPVEGKRPPKWWNYFAGNDWGWRDPQAFGLFACDEIGAVHLIESFQVTRLEDDEQAEKICDLLERWGVDKDDCPIACDPTMWNKPHARNKPGFVGEANIEAYHRAGLSCAPADNNRQAGFSVVRAALKQVCSDKKPVLRIWKGYNADVIRLFPMAQFSKVKSEDMAEGPWDHLVGDMIRYALRTRPEAAVKPRTKNKWELELEGDERKAKF